MSGARRLKRVTDEAWLGGVCAGLAYHFGISVVMMRLIWLLIFVSLGVGLLIYLLLWVFVPAWEETPEDYEEVVYD